MDKSILIKEIQTQYLELIKSGAKRYEGRLKTKIQEWDLKIGKRIKFYDKENPDSFVLIEIIGLHTFSDFGTAYDKLGSELIPNKSRNEVVKLYNEIYHYPNEEISDKEPSKIIKDIGVVAIEMKVITLRPLE